MLFGKRKAKVKRILIVEDEPLVAFDNETMIGEAGYTVVATVDRASEALAILDRELQVRDDDEEHGVDLVLTDIALTGDRNGVDLAREASARGVPVLFATGNPPDGADRAALGHLLKPYNDRTLKAALKAVDRHLSGEKVKAPDGLVLY
ncbi:response regulator [Sphingomonas arenae]|uniref:response regulator n=1 Tax=Sphingomonas arenae TaxID=2812555 RepID=UPI0019670531|nr:response regulator [Sphingomonas arenae]